MHRPFASRHLPLLALLAAALLLGILVLPHYGESWDEADIRRYSAYAVNAYRFLFHPSDLPAFETNLNLYGPGYFVIAGLVARLVTLVAPSWPVVAGWHAAHFCTFLVAVALLYLLALRWMSERSAFGVALLFITQPLFWGHAFINPKDIPFLAFFLGAVYSGFRMVDRLDKAPLLDPDLALAGVLLGLTASLRVLGPLSGVLVLLFAFSRWRSRALLPIVPYLLLAGLTSYLSWPYLWAAPLSRFLESLQTMADFPFNSAVLFGGAIYKADQLPAMYVPTILAIQLTEPAIVLITAGIVFAILAFFRGGARGPLLLVLGWCLVPAAVIVASSSPLYDNARQLYFLLPPLFIAAGLAFERLFARFPQGVIQGVILLLAALPGMLIGVRLHPYEYVYYNSLVHGTGGAFRDFETDYWGTSFDDVSREMNAALPAGSKVLVYGPEQIVLARARSDLQVFIPRENTNPGYDFVILLTRSNADQRLCREAETIYSVGRRGAVFAELRRIPPGTKCQ